MQPDASRDPLAALVGLASVLVLASLLDSWVRALRQAASAAFPPLSVAWSQALASLLLAGCLAGLAWLLLARDRPAVWVAALYLLVGLAIVLFPALFSSLRPGLPAIFRGLAGPATPTSYLVQTAALLAALGGFSLLRRNK